MTKRSKRHPKARPAAATPPAPTTTTEPAPRLNDFPADVGRCDVDTLKE